MRILVVCGAGASSTFVAQRLRRAAGAQGLACTVSAGAEQALADDEATDLVLVGPHLAHALARIRERSAPGARVVLLPADVFADLDGSRTLELVRRAMASNGGVPA